MSIYASAIQLGVASGFVFGETVASSLDSWRWPYVLEFAVMAVLGGLPLLFDKDPRFLQRRNDGLLGDEKVSSLTEQWTQLVSNSTYIWLCLGQAAFVFTAGAVAFWGTDFQVKHFGVTPLRAALVLGGVVIICGLVATLLGSAVADSLLRPTQDSYDRGTVSEAYLLSKRTEIACAMLTMVTIVGACSGISGAIADQYLVFVVTFAIAVFATALANGPLNLAVLSSVRPELRGQSVAVQTFIYHLLGSFPSPYIVGWINESWGMYWGYLVTEAWLFFAVIAWTVAWLAVRRTRKAFHQEAPKEVSLESINSW